MTSSTDPTEPIEADKTSAPIALAAVGLGVLALLPSLLLLAILAGVSFVGLRFMWQLLHLMLS